MKCLRLFAIVGILAGFFAGTASAQDHIACVKVKDTLPKVTYTVSNIVAFGGTGTNCVVRNSAKEVCYAAYKIGVTPPPPGGGGLTPLLPGQWQFFCYKAKCSNNAFAPNPPYPTDQFGVHFGAVIKPKITKLCAPASASGAFLDE